MTIRMQDMTEWVQALKRSEKTIIVEGKKDKQALESLGIGREGKIVMLSKRPIYAIIEQVADNATDAIILTDLDKKGKELYGKLSSGLQRLGVRVDNKYREFLQKQRVSHIEGISSIN
mgnify:CR=1 FL=1